MDSSHSTIASDLAAGSGPLKLVKLRLTLSLLAMAILPLAIAAPLAYSILDGQQAAERLRAERDSTALAAAVGTRLDRTQQSVVRAAGSAVLAGLLATPAKTSQATARTTLLTIGNASDDGIREVIVEDTDGDAQLWMVNGKLATGALKPAPADDVLAGALKLTGTDAYRSSVHEDASGAPAITFAAPISNGAGTVVGIVRAEVSLAQVLVSGTSAVVGESVTATLLNESDAVLTQSSGSGGSGFDGASAIARVPGYGGWRVQVAEPRQTSALPLQLLGGLGLAVVLIGALIFWMARQVLRPAEELEASRGRLRELYEVARLDALRDALTGLGNHRAFQEEFDRQMELARRYNIPLGLILIDLDDFKLVNDTAGHAAGDQLLAEMGRITTAAVRLADRAFRIGGDEFAILVPHTDAEGARVLGRRLLANALENRPGSSVPNSFSFSVGISSIPSLASDRRQLYAQADSALYWAKTHGRTLVQVFDPAKHKSIGVHTTAGELSSSVAELTARKLLKPVYQPVVELATGRIIGYEALVRPTADSGFSNAGELFAAAESSGRQAELDQACLEVVIAGAARLPADASLSLNVSPRSLESAEFSITGLILLLAKHGIPPTRAIIELTERESVDDMDRLRQNIASCRAAGLRIAADDVGAGNAGLRLLSQLQFDIVKIDLSLVQGNPKQSTSLAVIRSLQELADSWGAWVIAEGVETPEQLELIRGLGITAAQGYLLARPGDSLEIATIDIGSLLARDDWLHALARSPQPLTASVSQSP